MSAKVWEKTPFSLLGSFPRGSRAACLCDRARRRRSDPIDHAGDGLLASRSREPGADDYDMSPDGKEVAFAADTDRTGIDSNFDIFIVPTAGGEARNLTTDNAADDLARCTAATAAGSRSRDRKSRGSTPTSERLMLVRPARGRRRAISPSTGTGRRSGLVWSRRFTRARMARSMTPARGASIASRPEAASAESDDCRCQFLGGWRARARR